MTKENPPEAFQPLIRAIGETVFNWSFIESALAAWIAIIYQSAGGDHHAKVIPYSLSPKLKFLGKCFNQIEALHPFAAEGTDIIKRIRAIKDHREVMVHGRVAEYHQENDSYTLVKIDLNKTQTMQVVKESRLSIVEILENAGEARAIGIAAHNLSVRLFEAFVQDDESKDLLRAL